MRDQRSFRALSDYEHIVHPLEPIFDERSRVLILGSLPSVLSRRNRFYYGNPQNRFWKVVSALTGESEPETIEEKTALLLRNNIAIWDVIAACDIKGSSDASIKNVVPIDIERILNACAIQAIFANGQAAARYYHRYLEPIAHIPTQTLPSTSPANATYSVERLIASWKALLPYLA